MLVTDLLPSQTRTIIDSLPRNESHLLEATVFTHLCDSLCDFFHSENQHYFRLMKYSFIKEKKMIDRKLARRVIKDKLSTGDYTLTGIAYHIQTPEDVVYDIVTGRIKDPSAILFRKIIKLHQTVRPELYKKILRKITEESDKEEIHNINMESEE